MSESYRMKFHVYTPYTSKGKCRYKDCEMDEKTHPSIMGMWLKVK